VTVESEKTKTSQVGKGIQLLRLQREADARASSKENGGRERAKSRSGDKTENGWAGTEWSRGRSHSFYVNDQKERRDPYVISRDRKWRGVNGERRGSGKGEKEPDSDSGRLGIQRKRAVLPGDQLL